MTNGEASTANLKRQKLVLEPDDSQSGSYSTICSSHKHKFDVLAEIRKNLHHSKIEISFDSGRVLKITPETTWDYVYKFLDTVFVPVKK